MEIKKVAFIGLRHGHITSLYQRIKTDPRFEIVAVCEEDANAAAEAAANWKIETTHNSFELMLNEVEFDILSIGDYYGIRGQRIIAGMKKGKHIIGDKPLCTSLQELDEIRELSAKSGLKVGVMLDFRDYPPVRAAKELIDSGALGEIHAINFGGQHPLNYGTRPWWYFEAGKHGGTINDIAIHGLDVAEYLTGNSITELTAARTWNAFADKEPHFNDSAQAMFVLANGCGCTADVSYAAPVKFAFDTPFYWRFTIWGKNGVAEFCARDKAVNFYDNNSGEIRTIPPASKTLSDYLNIFVNEIDGKTEALGSEHLLNVTEKALKLQAMADKA